MNTPSSKLHVTVTKRLSATPERAFDAWLDPALIGRWMFGKALRDEEILHIEADPRVDGAFSFLVRRQGHDIDHVGRYVVVDRPRRLEFTWGIAGESGDDPSRVIVEFTAVPNGCELRLTHEMDPSWADYADRTRAGWSRMLDELAVVLS